MKTNVTNIQKDDARKMLVVTRIFNAPLKMVWSAWTEPKQLDQWWAPKPYQTKTKSMDFKEGGVWLYCMVGPEGDVHWCRADYLKIDFQNYYSLKDAFCDEHGNKNTAHPSMHWQNTFLKGKDGTKVHIEITFEKVEDMEKIIEMGFEEGFTAAHNNLEELLVKKNVLHHP